MDEEGPSGARRKRAAPETFDDRGPPSLPAATTAPRPRRRRPLLLALVVALAGVAWLVVPGHAPEGSPTPAVPTAARPGGAVLDVLGAPTRGSLAGDRSFVDAVRRLPWPAVADEPVPPQASRRVVFAGEVPGGRWALVVGVRAGVLDGAWFTGPPSATPDRLTGQQITAQLDAGNPAALIGARAGALVVVAAPGDVVTVSDRPDVAADGRVTRTYRTVADPGGLAVAALVPSELPDSTATTVRVLRNGTPLAGTATEYLADATDAPPVAIHYLRGTPPRSGGQVAEAEAQQLLGRLGLPLRTVDVTALWVGFIPRPGGVSGAAAIVGVTVPSGAVVVGADWLVLVQSADYYVHGRCGQGILPAGAPVSRRVTALTCDFQSGGGVLLEEYHETPGGSLVVVGPEALARVRTYTGGGTLLQEYRATDGVVVAPLPLGVDSVEGLTAGGTGLGRVPLLGSTPAPGN